MIKRVLTAALALTVALTIAGCSGSESGDTVRMPESSRNFEGEQFQDVVDTLEDAGYTNVTPEPLGDLVTGFLKGEGEVKEVGVDGDTLFTTDDSFAPDVEIVVSYHSFPADEEPTETPAPSEDALTVENSPAFAALLTLTDYCSTSVADFATENKGKTVTFDGNVGALNKHGDSTTRYDILIGAGDYSETAQPGPAFQYRDVNTTSDLHFSEANMPDSIGVGSNLRFTAVIGEYEASSCLLQLKPVATEAR